MPTATTLPTPTASPSPSPTLFIEERVGTLEGEVADLKENEGISQFKEIAEIIQVAVTVGAVLVGGLWSYQLFVRNRQKYPRASISHLIGHMQLDDNKLLLHVGVTISNIGDVLLSLVSLETRIQQVIPLSDEVLESIRNGQNPVSEGETEIEWPLIDSQKLELEKGKHFEIEPGESQDIHHDFVLDADAEVIEVYTYLINEEKPKRKIAWDLTTLYGLRNGGALSCDEV